MNHTNPMIRVTSLKDAGRNTHGMYAAVMEEIQRLALVNGLPRDEMLFRLAELGLQAKRQSEQTWRAWETLSRREKQVTALICHGLTGRQIAARLVLSPETIKTHVRHIHTKFKVASRDQLRSLLLDWDFKRWLPEGLPGEED